jgi:Ca2+-binding RTX toxin-like protein
VEKANEGNDTVIAAFAYTLGANLENLVLEGSDNLSGTGNALDNTLTGNAGDNLLDGKAGADTLIGGKGNDTYYIDHAGDLVVENANEGTDTVIATLDTTLAANVEHLILSGKALIGAGNDLANTILGTSGSNTLYGLGGDDLLDGGSGADTLVGGAGNDVLIGGKGKDTLTGGAGNDIFRFTAENETTTAKSSCDVIRDFVSGEDRLDLSAFGPSLDFIGSNAFRKVAGELRFEFDGKNGWLSGDTNGDGKTDFLVELEGVSNIEWGDLLL